MSDGTGTRPPGWLRMGLELGPLLAFFVAYLWLRGGRYELLGREYDGFVLVTAGFIPLFLAATWALWRLTGRLSRMQAVTAVLVVVFGGLSVAFNDERFFKMKPTIIYALFSAILFAGLARGRSHLEYVMDGVLPLDAEGWRVLTRRLALFFAALAVANEAVWRSLSTDAWVSFKTFGLPLALLIFFVGQGRLLERHARCEEQDGQG